MIQKILLITLSGGCGAIARFGLAGLVHRFTGSSFPWGTSIVNVIGCFLFGLIWVCGENRFLINPEIRTIILVGFMGSFTTFSTFIFEAHGLLTKAEYLYAAGSIAFQLGIGFLFLVFGMWLGRTI